MPPAAGAKHHGEVGGDADRLQQPNRVHTVGKNLEVTHIPAVPEAHADAIQGKIEDVGRSHGGAACPREVSIAPGTGREAGCGDRSRTAGL